MRIITTIRQMLKRLDGQSVMAGTGIFVEHTPVGTRVSAKPADTDSERGMFAIVIPPPEDGEEPPVMRIAVEDTSFAKHKDHPAGIAHVNNQPFAVERFEMPDGERLPVGMTYVYLEYLTPVEQTDTEEAMPASCAIRLFQEMQESTPSKAYHLIGRVERIAGEHGADDRLEIHQDHRPGNLYMTWWGPCLHLLSDYDDIVRRMTDSPGGE